MRPTGTIALGLMLLAGFVLPSRAVIFYETADPNFNTTAPTGALANSGWQFQGQWGAFLGTPVGPQHFLAAKHVGGQVGDLFTLNGAQYTTTARFLDAGSDLALWQVTPSFPNWSELYSTSDEAGQRIIIFGRGTTRGTAVQVNNALGPSAKGWQWGSYDGVTRWGENTIADILDANGNIVAATLANGTILRAHFDANGGANEAALSWGDSSGAVFINATSGWKLAGINYAVDGSYNTSTDGAGFSACIYDEGGLYQGGENNWVLTPDLPSSQPGSFYITRISVRMDWIRSIIGEPGAPPESPILEFATALNLSFTEDSAAVFDSASIVIRTPNPQQQRFFRIRAALPIEITGLRVDGSDLVLTCRYQ